MQRMASLDFLLAPSYFNAESFHPMNLPKSRTERLREMISLEEKGAGLQQEIESIAQQLTLLHRGLSGGVPAASSAGQAVAPRAGRKTAPKTTRKRGALKETIL